MPSPFRSINIRVDEPPKGKSTVRGGKGRHYTAKPTEEAMRRFALRAGDLYDGPTMQAPITMELVAILPRPKRRPRWLPREDWQAWKDGARVPSPITPDLSNVLKLAEDALQRCRLCGERKAKCQCGHFRPTIGDDAWIVDNRQTKFVAAKGEDPHVFVALTGRVG
jgi:Holliday junction resolvase RusA-like endonuclease